MSMRLQNRLSRLEKKIGTILTIDINTLIYDDVSKLTDEELIKQKREIEQYLDQHGGYDRDKFKHLTDEELHREIQEVKQQLLAQLKQSNRKEAN